MYCFSDLIKTLDWIWIQLLLKCFHTCWQLSVTSNRIDMRTLYLITYYRVHVLLKLYVKCNVNVRVAACPDGKFGVQCNETCACVSANSNGCSPVTGCVCNAGWKGVNCEIDVDECALGTDTCTAHSTCSNTDGTYVCPCDAGYTATGNTCTGMSLFRLAKVFEKLKKWCNKDFLQWCHNSIQCAVRKNAHKTIFLTETCINMYMYVYKHHTNITVKLIHIAACSNNGFGNNCSTPCDCVNSHAVVTTQACNHVTGTCECNAFWTGSRCAVDVDECTLGTHKCSAANGKYCHNEAGGFTCSCLRGFTANAAGLCVQDGRHFIWYRHNNKWTVLHGYELLT